MASRAQVPAADEPTYEADGAAWAVRQAELLRSRRFDALDIEHIAEEIGYLATREFDILTAALTNVLVHLIKWDYQPWERSRFWYNFVCEHRRRIVRQLRDNPSLESRLGEALSDVWPDIVGRVLLDTHMSKREFPIDCPYDWNSILHRQLIWPLP